MLAASPATRVAFWLVSLGMHATAFAVLGGLAGSHASSPGAPAAEVAIELEAAAEPAADEASRRAPVATSVPFVPPVPPHPAAPLRSDVRSSGASAAAPTPVAATDGPPDEVVPSVDTPATIARPVRFVLAMRSDGNAATRPPGAPSPQPGSDASPLPEAAVTSGALRIAPTVPAYPSKAYAMGVEGDVVLSIVVTSSGRVADARVVQGAGFGFDEATLADIRAARFEPARREGRPVAVRMRWSWAFRLR